MFRRYAISMYKLRKRSQNSFKSMERNNWFKNLFNALKRSLGTRRLLENFKPRDLIDQKNISES